MTQFIVTHRTSRKQQIMNGEEFLRFFKCCYDKQTKEIKYMNKLNDYAYSEIKSKENKAEEFMAKFTIATLGVVLVVLITKLIMLCL